MKLSMIVAAAGVALVLSACDQPYQEKAETMPPAVEAPVAPAATDQTAPVADTAAPTTAPSTTTLPADERSSEQSVQPESETLFY